MKQIDPIWIGEVVVGDTERIEVTCHEDLTGARVRAVAWCGDWSRVWDTDAGDGITVDVDADPAEPRSRVTVTLGGADWSGIHWDGPQDNVIFLAVRAYSGDEIRTVLPEGDTTRSRDRHFAMRVRKEAP